TIRRNFHNASGEHVADELIARRVRKNFLDVSSALSSNRTTTCVRCCPSDRNTATTPRTLIVKKRSRWSAHPGERRRTRVAIGFMIVKSITNSWCNANHSHEQRGWPDRSIKFNDCFRSRNNDSCERSREPRQIALDPNGHSGMILVIDDDTNTLD